MQFLKEISSMSETPLNKDVFIQQSYSNKMVDLINFIKTI